MAGAIRNGPTNAGRRGRVKQLKHNLPIAAHFEWALAVTLSAPVSQLGSLVAPGLELDSQGKHGFLAIACVQTRSFRPSFLPPQLGFRFFLVGYRLFTRFRSRSGRVFRGLQILGSETDSRLMVIGGKLLTHYGYRQARTKVGREKDKLQVTTSTGLDLTVRLDSSELPSGSVFTDWHEARRYAGPMPYTFGSEDDGRSIMRVQGVRTHWNPRPVTPVLVSAPLIANLLVGPPALASAFLVENVDYSWKRGVREKLPQ